MRWLLAAAAICGALFSGVVFAQAPPRVVAYVELALRNGDLDSASAMVAQYRRLNGDTPEALEAFSWVARGELAAGNADQAWKDAEEIKKDCQASLGTRSLDAEPDLPVALGAAYELEADILTQRHERTQAIALLETAQRQWRGTSVADRMQKNLNLMMLVGRPMPVLRETEWIGEKPAPVTTLRGKVVLLFFWAHWCADCKQDIPVVKELATELEPHGLIVIAPTKRYGYTAQEEHAAPATETAFIQKVYDALYAGIPGVEVPLDASNFERFGATTIPTFVVVDRRGIVRLYHPGVMEGKDLLAAIEPLLKPQTDARGGSRTTGR